MRKIAAALLGLFTGADARASAQPQTTDPAIIYFSVSTIANDMAPLEPVGAAAIGPAELVMHEDDWRQIEFFPASRLPEIQRMLAELARFEAANRHGELFRNVYVRTLPDAPVLSGAATLDSLARELDSTAGPGPVFLQSAEVASGRGANGFTLALAGNVRLYGFRRDGEVMVLGAQVGAGGDHAALTRAFARLNRDHGLVLVDWRSHLLLTGVAADGDIEAWRPD